MSKYREVPVFFDPDQKRWPRLRRGVFLSGAVLSSLFGILIVSVLINPILPRLNLPQSSILPKGAHPPTAEPIETPAQLKLRLTKERLEIERSKRRAARRPAQHPLRRDHLAGRFLTHVLPASRKHSRIDHARTGVPTGRTSPL